jgi:hypothetical protein
LNSTAACKIQAAWRHHRDASKIRQDPAVPVAVKSKARDLLFFNDDWRRNRRKMDDSVDDLCHTSIQSILSENLVAEQ